MQSHFNVRIINTPYVVGALWRIGSSSRLVIRGSVVRVRPVRMPLVAAGAKARVIIPAL